MYTNGATRLKTKFMTQGAKVPKYNLTKNNSFLVFPFDLVMGYVTSTENGIRNNDSVNVFDYSTFERIFTGLENVLARWKGSYNVIKKDPADTFLTKEYNVGDSFKAYIPQESLSATYAPTSISGDFLSEFTEETFNLHTYNEIEESDLFRLYIIPELKEEKWLYVTDAQKFYLPSGAFHHAEITLSTLNNQIAKSGKAVEEYIQRTAPGEGYAWPLVDDNQGVSVDHVLNRDIPATSIQIEGSGAYAMGTIFAWGRPVAKGDNGQYQFNEKIEAPRLLLPLRLETAIPSPINTRPSAETDWLVGSFTPTLEEDYENWKEQFQGAFDPGIRAKYEGMLQAKDKTAVEASNPINEGTRNNLLWDVNWKPNVTQTYNTSTNAMTGDSLVLNGQYSMTEILAHNVFGLDPYTTLPLNVKQNVSWSLKDIPLVGGFLSKLTFGVPLGWQNTSVKVKMTNGILVAVPASLSDYANVVVKQGTDLKIGLETFVDDEASSDAIEYSGIKATGSIWKTQLTDLFSKGDYVFNTVYLGQYYPDKDENGKDVADNLKGTILYWDETCKPTQRKVDGYILDTSTTKFLGKMDYRITIFSNSDQIWSGTYQSNAKFTGSIRDWTNAIKFSNWNASDSSTINFPDNIVSPNPPNTLNPRLEIFNKMLPKTIIGPIRNAVLKPFKIDFSTFTKASYQTVTTLRGSTPATLYYATNSKNVIGEAQLENSKDLVYEFDTSKYGGINSIRNNYEKLEIKISKYISFRNPTKTIELKTPIIFEIPLAELVPQKNHLYIFEAYESGMVGDINPDTFITINNERLLMDSNIFDYKTQSNQHSSWPLFLGIENDTIQIFPKIVKSTIVTYLKGSLAARGSKSTDDDAVDNEATIDAILQAGIIDARGINGLAGTSSDRTYQPTITLIPKTI